MCSSRRVYKEVMGKQSAERAASNPQDLTIADYCAQRGVGLRSTSTVVAFRASDGFSPVPLTDLLRQGALDLIAQAVEAELNASLTAHADQTDAAGCRRRVRHGHLPEREIQPGIGAVPVKVHRVRDRAPSPTFAHCSS